MEIGLTKLFEYLNKIGVADKVFIYEDEIVFYHWNKLKTDLKKLLKNGYCK